MAVMTVKEQLHDYVSGLSDDEAASLWQRLHGVDLQPLTNEDREAIRRGLDDAAAGRTSALEDVERELGLAN